MKLLILVCLLPATALAEAPLPPSRPMAAPDRKAPASRAVVVGEMPDCAALAQQSKVPDPLKARLRQASVRGKAWQRLYTQTWTDFGEFEKRCRAYVSAANRKTQDAATIAALGRSEVALQSHLGVLRVEAVSLSPPAKPGLIKPKAGSFLVLKKDVTLLQQSLVKEKESNLADQASKCASTLGAQSAALNSAVARFEARAKTLCALPATSFDSESNTGEN